MKYFILRPTQIMCVAEAVRRARDVYNDRL